jgi:copper chaperone CopZ
MEDRQVTIRVDGMSCSHCERAVVELATEVEGVSSAIADATSSQLTLTHTGGEATTGAVIRNINENSNYKASIE